MTERSGWKVKEMRSFIFSNKFLDKLLNFIAPHVYIIAENNISFKYPPKKVKEWEGDEYYKDLLNINNEMQV
ncbi:MAG: hypothetical protein ABIA02_02245 [Candidatus Falkowbacteria bacterium]